jgi:hypothetical protein
VQLALNGSRQAVLTGTGPAGYKYDILATQDLVTWVPIANITMNPSGMFQFTDTSAPTIARRFYSLRQTSP